MLIPSLDILVIPIQSSSFGGVDDDKSRLELGGGGDLVFLDVVSNFGALRNVGLNDGSDDLVLKKSVKRD